MSDVETRTLYAEAILGKDAEEFLNGDLGRYMLARAEEEEREAIEALATVWSWRRKRIADLQAKMWRARSFKGWLVEMITAGHQAVQQLENLQDD